MKIDSIDSVTSFDTTSSPLGNEDKSIMTSNKSSLSDLNYTPYKPINITGQAKKAYNYYLNRGVKANVAAGIVGNLYKESGLNPNAVGDKGTAYGVAQWRGDRLSNLKKYASNRGRSYTDLNTQLDFILDEQGENQVLTLMGNQSPEVAAKTFADRYERPNPKYADYSTRSSVAKQLGQMKLGGFIPQLKKGGLIGTQKVADYQKMLNEKYGAGLSEDGAWGNKTEEAYKKYILNVDNNIPISRTQSNSKGNYNINTNTGDTLFVDKPKANIINNKLTPNVSDNIKLNSTTKNLPKKVIPIPINNSISSSSTVVNKPTIDEYKKKPITPKENNSPKSLSFVDKAILAIQNPQSTWDNIINQFDKGNEKSNIKSKGIRAKENKPVTKSKSLTPTRPTFIYDYESEQKTPYRTKNSYHAPFTLDLSNNNNKKFDLVDASTFEKAKNHPELKNSRGIVINTFNEFGDVNDNNADVIQLKSDGSIDVGKRGSFKEGKFSKLNKIPLDLSDVDYIYDKDDKNYKIYSKKTKSEIPIYTSQKRNNLDEATDYGKYLGGKHILVSGKKKVLVNGSVKDFKNIADKLTKETGEPVSLYQLDNGAYNLPFMKSDNKLTREDIISHRNRHLTSGGVGLSLRAYKFGGVIPKYALGAGKIMGLVSQGMNLGAGFIDSTNDPENPNVAKSALSGFIKGNAALPGIGGILGGIAGIRDAKKQRELFQKKKDIENRGVMDYFNIRSKGILDNYNTQGEQGSFYAKGGIPNPQYEVEHGEVIVGDDVKLTGGKQLASNLHKVVGKTHDQFNPNTVNGTGEDGQGGQFIFSNRLKLGGKTFAKLAEGVAKQKAKAEEMMSHNDYIFKNTGQANAEIADAKLMQLAQIQEMMKEKNNPLGQFPYGGNPYDKGKKVSFIGNAPINTIKNKLSNINPNSPSLNIEEIENAINQIKKPIPQKPKLNKLNIQIPQNFNIQNETPETTTPQKPTNPPITTPSLNTPRRKRELMSDLNGSIKPEVNPLPNTRPDEVTPIKDRGIREGEDFLTNWYAKRNKVTKPIDVSNSFNTVRDNLPAFQGARNQQVEAYYDPNDTKTHFRKNEDVSTGTATHEFTHSIDDRYGNNSNNRNTKFGNNKEVLKTDYTEIGVKPKIDKESVVGRAFGEKYDYYTKPTEVYARLNELRQVSGLDPNYTVTLEDIQKIKKDKSHKYNQLFTFYSDEDIMNMWNGLSSNLQRESFSEQLNGDNGLRNARYGGVIHRFRLGGFIPQYAGGGDLTAEQAYEKAYKDLQRTAKARATKATNLAAKKAADAAYEAAYKTEQELAKKVGKEVTTKVASRLGTVGKVLGAGAESITNLLNNPLSILRPGLPSDFDKERWAYEQTMKYGDDEAKARARERYNKTKPNSKTNPNELTIPQRRALRRSVPIKTPNKPTSPLNTPQRASKPNNSNVNKPNLDTGKKPNINIPPINIPTLQKPILQNATNTKLKSPDIRLNEIKDYSNTVQGNSDFSPIRENNKGINTDNLAPVAGALMNGINYFANQNMINKYKTQTPATLLQNPNYQYFDRSGNARASVRGITNSVINNPFLNQGTKQVALANSMNVINDVNQQELNRKQEYDRSYRGQQIETENRNAMILNQARQQTMQNENQKQGLRQDNLNNLFGNINTNLAEFQANKQQDKAMQYMSLPYFKRVGLLTKEQQAEFMKNPTSFLMGENELPKNKKGGRIKMKYC